MSKLQKALYELDRMERMARMRSPLHSLDPRAKLLVTLGFLFAMLSLPLNRLSDLMIFAIFPIISCAASGISYGYIFKRSLWVLPFIIFIGIFNPVFDREVVFLVGNVAITAGWISFFSILLRGVLSVQAVLILILTTGFYPLCRGIQQMGVPSVLATQLLFVYRYLFVLLQEALSMNRALTARGFGRQSFPFRTWGVLIGQLLIRTVSRAERINRAMLSRGFTGTIRSTVRFRWRGSETSYLIVWVVLFLLFRLFHPIETVQLFFPN